jgi:hypothetical protein
MNSASQNVDHLVRCVHGCCIQRYELAVSLISAATFRRTLEPEEIEIRAAHEGWRNSVEPFRRVIGGKYSAT